LYVPEVQFIDISTNCILYPAAFSAAVNATVFVILSSLDYSPLPLLLFFMTVSPFFVGIINSQTTETLFSPLGTSVPPLNSYFAVAVC